MTIHPAPKPPRRAKARRQHGSTLPAPKKRPSVTRKRKASEWARAYGSRARVQWIAAQPCLVGSDWCGRHARRENAHVATGGMGRKADAELIVPLCHSHHRALHRHGVRSFEKQYYYIGTLVDAAARTEARWQEQLRAHGAPTDPQHSGT